MTIPSLATLTRDRSTISRPPFAVIAPSIVLTCAVSSELEMVAMPWKMAREPSMTTSSETSAIMVSPWTYRALPLNTVFSTPNFTSLHR